MTVQGLTHGAKELPSVIVDSYNLELSDAVGFVGDRASKSAFAAILEEWRAKLRESGEDPLGDTPTEEISKKDLDKLLNDGDSEAAGLVHGAVEEFAQALAGVVRRFLRLKAWRDTEHIVVGGGFRGGRVGELAIGRASVALKADGIEIDMTPIHHDPHEAGLLGAAHLAPSWIFEGHDSLAAVDIGGSNIRAGIVEFNRKKARDLSKAAVWKTERWRYADEKEEPSRDELVSHLAALLSDLIKKAEKEGLKLAPFIGIGCPGVIADDGTIKDGGQNLPGNWESSRFHLPTSLLEAIPRIGDHDTMILMHNDAVVQGLSEVPFMQEHKRWAVLTIGTGLGNARFTNRNGGDEADD
jgi:predicted NBD/HSP70 family sugar kinase